MIAAGVEQIRNSANICEKYSKRIDGYQCNAYRAQCCYVIAWLILNSLLICLHV